MRTRARAIALCCGIGLSGAAHAQSIFEIPGGVKLTALPKRDYLAGPDKNGYVYSFGELNAACWDPANKDATIRYTGGLGSNLPLVTATQPGALARIYSQSAGGYHYFNFDCAVAQATAQLPTLYDPPLLGKLPSPEAELANSSGLHVRLADGRACYSSFEADNGQWSLNWRAFVKCVVYPASDPQNNPATVETIVDLQTLDDKLGLVPYSALDPGPAPLVSYGMGVTLAGDEGWQVKALNATEDGRLFVMAHRRTIYREYSNNLGGYSYPTYLLERLADGSIAVIASPASPILHGKHNDALTRAATLFYDSRIPALFFPGSPQWGTTEWGNYLVPVSGVGYAEYGPGGFGLGVASLAEVGNGYLSLTDAVNRLAAANNSLGPIRQFPGGRFAFLIGDTDYQIDFDPDKLDLDGDGLTAAEEKLLGTSDLRADSDRGGVDDLWEARVAGSDPKTGSDDQAGFVTATGLGYVSSSAARKKLPAEVVADPRVIIPSLSPDAPLCAVGKCYDVRGNVTATYTLPASASNAVISADATYLAWRDGITIHRMTFATGQSEEFVSAADFALHLGSAPTLQDTLWPIDASLVYYVRNDGKPRVVAFRKGQPPELALDWDKAGCDSQLGSCSTLTTVPMPFIPPDLLIPTAYPMGWDRELGRFLVGAKTNWRQFVLGFAPGKPVEVVKRRYGDPYLVRQTMVPSGHGDYYTEVGFLAPDLRFLSVGGRARVFDPLHVITVWGDTMIVNSTEGAGPFEFVRYSPKVDPGEVFGLYGRNLGVGERQGAQLLRHNLRGGAYTAWFGQFPTSEYKQITGADVTAELRLCTADVSLGLVREYVPALPGQVPEVEVSYLEVQGARDCLYGKDGTLWVLVSNPGKTAPALKKRLPGATDFVTDETFTLPPLPRRFIKKLDGSFEFLGATDDTLGKLYTRSGHTVTLMRGSNDVFWDGAPIANVKAALLQDGILGSTVSSGYPGSAALAERPDGQIVIAWTEAEPQPEQWAVQIPLVVDPRDGSVARFGLDDASATVVVTVPGGISIDPWSGDSIPVAQPGGGLPSGVSVPAAPTGGTPEPKASGCTVGSRGEGSLDGALLLLAMLLGYLPGRWRRRLTIRTTR